MAWMFSSVLMTTLEGHVSWSKFNFFGREVWGPFVANRRVPGGQMTPTPQDQRISRIRSSAQ